MALALHIVLVCDLIDAVATAPVDLLDILSALDFATQVPLPGEPGIMLEETLALPVTLAFFKFSNVRSIKDGF